ncbi:SIS domain-containing protein [Solimonas terrae]|uniref:SIS domain-containing protein n=1 Tax=Solimonas terrae TaxID=1396819 RepID=A0A6M2BPI9_9GAMM|nr:SIS domain-containing protein [Solimonas terrae]NGY04284.1 SIS domain-containing protein [Solimonas terrae]
MKASRQKLRSSALLSRIRASLAALRKSERAVAEFVLAHPDQVLQLPIADLATRAGVSQPTVARFAGALGFSGYREFKLRLAQSLASGVPFIHQDVGPDDKLERVSAKVFDRTIGSLLDVRNHLDSGELARAVAMLTRARRIDFYGIGNSGIVALDGQHKFFRYGVPTASYLDPHAMAVAATVLGRGDVVVAISATGRTTDMLATAAIAIDSGAQLIAITASGSPLARLASVSLAADVPEDPDVYTPMISRIAHLAIVDVLAVAVALAMGPPLLSRLERGKQILREKRVQSSES